MCILFYGVLKYHHPNNLSSLEKGSLKFFEEKGKESCYAKIG